MKGEVKIDYELRKKVFFDFLTYLGYKEIDFYEDENPFYTLGYFDTHKINIYFFHSLKPRDRFVPIEVGHIQRNETIEWLGITAFDLIFYMYKTP